MTESEPLDFDEVELLHILRVRGSVPQGELEGVDPLLERGYVVPTKVGLLISPSGMEVHASRMATWRERADLESVRKGYSRFLAVNDTAKSTCSRWQVSGGDAAAVQQSFDALTDALSKARAGLRRAATVVPRFERYTERLAGALEEVEKGETRYFTDPTVDSFHTVWFECHEDFLLTLGISREQEGSF